MFLKPFLCLSIDHSICNLCFFASFALSCYFSVTYSLHPVSFTFFWSDGLSETTSLPHKGSGKVCVRLTLSRLYLWICCNANKVNSCSFLLQAARMRFIYENEPYCLNLIDTPGHVDFSYEVCGRNGLTWKCCANSQFYSIPTILIL